jgi:CRP/FNR family cyclic AMP-dependent transcriptional regulator
MDRKNFDPDIFLANVGPGKTIVKCKKGDVLFRQGDTAAAIFFVQKGKVKLTVLSDRGKEAVIALVDAGSFFGEGCLNGHPRRLSTAIALVDGSILRVEKKTMLRVLAAEPALATRVMMHLLDRNSRVEEDLIDQLFNSSEKRLARMLLLMAHFGKDGKPEPVIPRVSQETLAEMVGTTRSRISFFMNKFRKLGFVDYNDALEVHNSLLNVILKD